MTNRTSWTHPDLETAGIRLAEAVSNDPGRNETLVLAIANGGVPVAIPVAEKMRVAVDVVVIRRLFTASKQHGDICATSVADHLIFADGFVAALANPITPEDHFVHDALTQLSQSAVGSFKVRWVQVAPAQGSQSSSLNSFAQKVLNGLVRVSLCDFVDRLLHSGSKNDPRIHTK